MKFAFLLCGTPRTFVFEQQINHFKYLKLIYPTADFYILIRLPEFKTNNIIKFKPGNPYTEHFIQTDKGLENFNKQLENIKPIYLKVFNDYKYENYLENKFNSFSQWYMIDFLLKKAENYSKINNFNYDYFIRYRLDWTFTNNNFDFNNFDKNYIYSEIKGKSNKRKSNNIGADFLFILSNKLYKNWWINTIDNKLKLIKKTENSLWIGVSVKKINLTNGGLVRDYNIINFWDKKRDNKFNHKLYWENFNFKDYELMHKIQSNKDLYFKNLNNILIKFNTNYSFYLED